MAVDIPDAVVKRWDGHWWHRIPNDERFVSLGICPAPAGPWQTFRYHVLHGLLMGYPLVSILRFAWRNRRSFD